MDAQPNTDAPPTTARLAGRYELGEPLGRGRSTVFRATDTRLRRAVAIKQVEVAVGQEDADRARTRARREAQAAARLNDPRVVTVYDVVEEDGAIWLVMELVEAPSLAQLVESGPLSHPRAARVGLDVLAALDAAHRVGIVHRDAKPANVLVTDGDLAKLTDFGVATIRDESRLTATGLIVGSPSYMAPEQARGAEVGPATDLWALGAMLYFATEGTPPFAGDTALATASAVVHGEPRPPRRPGGLTGLLARLLTKDPADRPPASQVRATLARVAETPLSDRTGARSRRPGAAPAGLPPTRTATPAATRPARTGAPAAPPPATPAPASGRSPADRPATRGRLALLAGTAVAVVALAATVGALRGGPGGDDPTGAAGTAATTAPGATATSAGPAATTATTAAPTTTTPPTTDPAAAGLPAGWTAYHDAAAGYTIGYPPGWRVVRAGGPRVDFRDPKTGAYLRVDWTASPGSDPAADWRQQAAGFARRHPGYQEIGIAPTTYRDYDAALWEFRYGAGPRLHAADLGFVTGGKGYALLFQAPEADWAADQAVLAQFKAAFRP